MGKKRGDSLPPHLQRVADAGGPGVSVGEIAEQTGLTRRTVSNYRQDIRRIETGQAASAARQQSD